MGEKAFEASVIEALEILGYDVDKFSQRRAGKCKICGNPVYAGTQQTLGIPDLRARHLARQIVVWLEVKFGERGRLSRVQRRWLEREIEAGGKAAPIWTGADLAFVMRAAGDTRFDVPFGAVTPTCRSFVDAWSVSHASDQPTDASQGSHQPPA